MGGAGVRCGTALKIAAAGYGRLLRLTHPSIEHFMQRVCLQRTTPRSLRPTSVRGHFGSSGEVSVAPAAAGAGGTVFRLLGSGSPRAPAAQKVRVRPGGGALLQPSYATV